MANDNWRTPVEVFAYYDKTYDFQCDVAASENNALCERYYTEKTNALTSDGQPVKQNNKPQCAIIVPPYVRSGEPFTNYVPLAGVMADGLTALQKRLSL